MSGDLDGRIRERAYQLWLEQGRPEGREREHWDEAARLVHSEELGHADTDERLSIGKPAHGSVIADKAPGEDRPESSNADTAPPPVDVPADDRPVDPQPKKARAPRKAAQAADTSSKVEVIADKPKKKAKKPLATG